MRMGCGASTGSRAQQDADVSPKSATPLHPRSYSSGIPHHSIHVPSIATQPHLAQQHVTGSLCADPPPDPLGQICAPANEPSAAPSASAIANEGVMEGDAGKGGGVPTMERSSPRLGFGQMRSVAISHSALAAVPPLSGGSYPRICIASSEDVEAQRKGSPIYVQQRRDEDEHNGQHRLCKQSLAQSTNLPDIMNSLSSPSNALVRQEQPFPATAAVAADTPTVGRHSPTFTAMVKLRSSTSMQDQPSQSTLQLSRQRVSDATATSSKGNARSRQSLSPSASAGLIMSPAHTATAPAAAAAATAATITTPVAPEAAVDASGLDVEYLDNGSNFDIDSTDEDSEGDDSTSVHHLQIALSATTPSRGGAVLSRAQPKPLVKQMPQPPIISSSLPPVTAYTSIVMNGVMVGGGTNGNNANSGADGGGLRLQHTAESTSLVSLADTPDDMCTPSSPRSTANDRLDSVSPIFNGLASGTVNWPMSSSMVGAPRNGRVDQSNNNGLATFFNQPRECANCKSLAVAFACEVCENFFLCEECRFNVGVVRTIHDPTHAMLSIQDNHCGSSRSFGGDSVFSLSGDGGASSLFNPPCTRCGRVIDDTEAVYRCEQCDYVLCQECFFKSPKQAVESDGDSSHEHILKRFQRKSKSGLIHESAVVNKTRNSGGNRVINDYVVVRLLGRGSYAKVKLVQHIRTQELFALKILKRQKKSSYSAVNLGRSRVKLANAGVSEDDLLREIAVMKFIDHPNITKLKEVIEDVEAQKVYVIMEYCENGPVHVLDSLPLELERVRQYGADIMRGLLYLHSEFLYHRDIKPANCLVNYENVVKIADFGTCNSQIRTKSSEGTLAFSCPEQVRGEEVSGEVVDSWAFALTLYEMAYGTLPVSTTSLIQHRNTLLGPEPIPIPDKGDPELRDLLVVMLNKNLKSRMLLSAAARHPFFASFHIDPHGAPHNSTQHQLSLSKSPSSRSTPSPRGEQQQKQKQQQEEALTELYDKALESVYRGKNLKDCFHGVRALRRIRRKEAETARHASGGTGGVSSHNSNGGSVNEDDEDMAYYFDDDEDAEDSPPRSPPQHGYGGNSSNNSTSRLTNGNEGIGGEGRENRPQQQQQKNHNVDRVSTTTREEEAAAAASAVEEIVQHYLLSKETKVEVAYINLSRQSTLEKLNQLSATMTEMRLGHNALVSTAGLRFSSFSMLKEISISFNHLDAFPEDVLLAPRLVRLDLSHNRIPSIPPSLVSRAPFLERLNLHHNFITHVGTVPCPNNESTTTTASRTTSAVAAPLSTPANSVKAKNAWIANNFNGTATTTTATAADAIRTPHQLDVKPISVLAAPCLRHVRLSGNPLESLPLALESTNRLELVLDAVPALMEQWEAHTQFFTSAPTATASRTSSTATVEKEDASTLLVGATKNSTTGVTLSTAAAAAVVEARNGNGRAGSAPSATTKMNLVTAAAALITRQQEQRKQQTPKSKLPAVIVWDDSFPVRIPNVEPAVWLAVNNMAVYRVQTLRTCRTRRVVLCQCADPRFPNGAFDSADLEAYFAELTKALQQHRQERQQQQQGNGSFDMSGPSSEVVNGALPPIVGRAARSYVESYFFVTDDESEEDGGYHNLVEYLNDALAAKEPVLVVVVTSGNASAVRTNIVAALSTCLAQLRGSNPDGISEQAELVVNTMRSLYA